MPNIYKISHINPEKEAREHQICAFITGWNNNSLFWQRVWFSLSHAKHSAWLEHQEMWPLLPLIQSKNNKNGMETLFLHFWENLRATCHYDAKSLLCGHYDILNVFSVAMQLPGWLFGCREECAWWQTSKEPFPRYFTNWSAAKTFRKYNCA